MAIHEPQSHTVFSASVPSVPLWFQIHLFLRNATSIPPIITNMIADTHQNCATSLP